MVKGNHGVVKDNGDAVIEEGFTEDQGPVL
jgi:hypothetical protein